MTQAELSKIVAGLIEELRNEREISGSFIASVAVKQGRIAPKDREALRARAAHMLEQAFDPVVRQTRRKAAQILGQPLRPLGEPQ